MTISRLPVVSFVVAEFLALLGNSAFMVAFPWLVLSYTGSAGLSSSMTAVVMVPTAIVTLAAGRLIDRIGRKRASVIAGLGCTLAATALCLVDSAGLVSVPALIVLGMSAQLFVSPSTTARDALMDDIAIAGGIPMERLAGMRQVVFSIAYSIGPALAGILLGAVPSFVVIGLVALAWAVATCCTLGLSSSATRLPSEEAHSAGETSLVGLLRSRRSVRAAIIIGFGTAVISSPMTSVILPAHFTALGQPQLYGMVVSAFAVGALVGSLAYAALSKRAGKNVYIGAIAITTVGIAGFAFLPSFGILALALLIGGIGSGLLAPMLLVAVTKSTSQNERGRALGAYNAASLGAGPIGLGLLGVVLRVSPDLRTGSFAILAVWIAVGIYALTQTAAIVAPDVPDPASECERR